MRLTLIGLFMGFVWAQQLEKVEIQSSRIVCSTCKRTIIRNLSKVKGIHKVDVSVEEKKIWVEYEPDKIRPKEIREAIRKIGYDADDMRAYPEAFEKLPACCKAPHP
ncbi:MAG: heavy-metal-associated domain-containing protein [Bacteroidia bacterium]